MDSGGNDILNSGQTMEWLPTQSVQDVIAKFGSNVPRKPWERIVVCQGDQIVEEDVALGYVADLEGTVQFTFVPVPMVHNSKARADTSLEQFSTNAGWWDDRRY